MNGITQKTSADIRMQEAPFVLRGFILNLNIHIPLRSHEGDEASGFLCR